MKKLMCAVAALSAGICMADITSANIVGYQTQSVVKGGTYAFAIQFQTVDGVEEIPVKDLLTVATPVGATSAGSSDQIWQYTDADGWKKYFYYKRGTTTEWRLSGGAASETKETLKVGTAFFFVRPNTTTSSDTTITLSGAVKPLTDTKTYPVVKGETVMMANPWPIQIAIADFNNYNKGTAVGATSAGSSDQIWRYDDTNGWRKYFYYKRGTTTEWRLGSSATNDKIEPGEGFFFVRPNTTTSSDTTIEFKGPDAK